MAEWLWQESQKLNEIGYIESLFIVLELNCMEEVDRGG